MKRLTCKSCGYIPKVRPNKPTWVCPNCGKKTALKRKKTGSGRTAARVKTDPEVEQLLEPLDRTYLPPPREKLFLFHQGKESNE